MNMNDGITLDLSSLRKDKASIELEKRKIRVPNRASTVMNGTLIVLIALSICGFGTFNYKNTDIIKSTISTLENFKTIFFEPRFNHFNLGGALTQTAITMGLAFLTTLIGAFIALFIGLLAAQNLSKKWLSNAIKAFISFIRAVDTVLWVLIFAVAAGLGSVAAVIGMTFHTIGYLIKSYSESFEEIDAGVIEALKGTGANWWQIVFQAVIPSTLTYLLSWTFLRFEINFSVAVAMGAAAGAGGIGYDLFMASAFYYDLREIGIITYLILIIAVLLELFSTRMKIRLKER